MIMTPLNRISSQNLDNNLDDWNIIENNIDSWKNYLEASLKEKDKLKDKENLEDKKNTLVELNKYLENRVNSDLKFILEKDWTFTLLYAKKWEPWSFYGLESNIHINDKIIDSEMDNLVIGRIMSNIISDVNKKNFIEEANIPSLEQENFGYELISLRIDIMLKNIEDKTN